jgi:Cu(I)/Ag(I) efflux system membrane fusion protein
MIEIKLALNPSKKGIVTGAHSINSEYKFRKGSDPMAGMDM